MSGSLLGEGVPGPTQNLQIRGLNVRSSLSFLICKVGTVHALLITELLGGSNESRYKGFINTKHCPIKVIAIIIPG